MTVYIDAEFTCHVSGDDAMTAVEMDFFDGKCDAFIEGYRFIPHGESWTREDGVVFEGEQVFPWKNYDELDAAQRQHEQDQIADMKAALEILGVTADA